MFGWLGSLLQTSPARSLAEQAAAWVAKRVGPVVWVTGWRRPLRRVPPEYFAAQGWRVAAREDPFVLLESSTISGRKKYRLLVLDASGNVAFFADAKPAGIRGAASPAPKSILRLDELVAKGFAVTEDGRRLPVEVWRTANNTFAVWAGARRHQLIAFFDEAPDEASVAAAIGAWLRSLGYPLAVTDVRLSWRATL